MPLLGIAITHSASQNYLGYSRVQLFINGKVPNYALLQNEEGWASIRKSLQYTGNMNFYLSHSKKPNSRFLVKAVGTLEPKCKVQSKDGEKESNKLSSNVESASPTVQIESLSGNSEEVDDREKLRRLRISKANKGNTPWNKGRKHSPETLQRIKERTRLAMQSPKVKMKLVNLGHAQSPETREKIAVGVRMGWQKRREKLMLQETCLFDWQNLVAEAARRGCDDEEELQWDSYEILKTRFHQEWLDSIEYRKTVPRVRGSKRAPKSLEQRRKIAEAIAAKWADPEYRTRVCSALAKYHGIPEGAERKVRKKPRGEAQSTKTSKKKTSDAESSPETKERTRLAKLKKRNAPKYKDPLANSKLEMLKSIRAQRVASETRKNEALEQAKLLIAEAQRAAKALEVAATRSPVARASLMEAKKLIAEATLSIQSIENGESSFQGDDAFENENNAGKGGELREDSDRRYHKGVNGVGNILREGADQKQHKWVNGVESLLWSEGQNMDIDLYKMPMPDDVDKNSHLEANLGGYEYPMLDLESFTRNSDVKKLMDHQPSEPNGSIRLNGFSSSNGVKWLSQEEHSPPAKTVTKKWVRGKLVDVMESE